MRLVFRPTAVSTLLLASLLFLAPLASSSPALASTDDAAAWSGSAEILSGQCSAIFGSPAALIDTHTDGENAWNLERVLGEALYTDMGHFGKFPIRLTWFSFVLPALVLNYFGQGSLLLSNPQAIENPFYLLAPAWALAPMAPARARSPSSPMRRRSNGVSAPKRSRSMGVFMGQIRRWYMKPIIVRFHRISRSRPSSRTWPSSAWSSGSRQW